jgi:hypothetical protein
MTVPALAQTNWAPRLAAIIEGVEIPSTSIEVKLSAYGTADEVTIHTFATGLSTYLGFSLIRTSQVFASKNTPMQVKVVLHSNGTGTGTTTPVFLGFLDIINIDYENDTCEITGRGVLSLLLDQKITTRVNNNQPVEQAISQVVSRYGLTPIITATSGETVGKIMRDLQVSTARNLSAFGYVQSLCNGIGWDLKVRGTSVVIGPPPTASNVVVIPKQWDANSGGSSLTVQHAAYHSHDIKVRVVSYLARKKSKVAVQSPALAAFEASIGMPPISPSAGSKARSTGGSQVGFANVPRTPSTRDEMYVYHVPGIDKAKALVMAQQIQAALSRQEILITLQWGPDLAEAVKFAGAGCEFNLLLSGVEESVINNYYWPKEITWSWSVEDGIKLSSDLANHPLPEDNQGTV